MTARFLVKLDHCKSGGCTLERAYLEAAELTGTNLVIARCSAFIFDGANLSGLLFEPDLSSLQDIRAWPTLKLQLIRFKPTALPSTREDWPGGTLTRSRPSMLARILSQLRL
jgi:Pentapeptide repeats (8 copies)